MGANSRHLLAVGFTSIALGCGGADRPPPGLGSWGAPTPEAGSTEGGPPPEAADGTSTGFDPQSEATSGSAGGVDSTDTGDGPGPGSPATSSSGPGRGGETTSTTGDETGDAGGSTTGPLGVFDPPQPFGDDQAELDLIGVWGLPRYGSPQSWEARLTIGSLGELSWVEHDDDCSIMTEGIGSAWVENNQLVLHFDTYLGSLPWPTEDAIGRSIEPPFRVRLGYGPAGSTLGLSAPPGWTSSAPWEGRAFLRQTSTAGPQGSWASESQLEGLVPGSATSQVIVVDRFDLELRADGTGLSTTTRTYVWPEVYAEPPIYRDASWVDGNPGNAAGLVTVSGRPFAYDSVRMVSFGQWDALTANPNVRCP